MLNKNFTNNAVTEEQKVQFMVEMTHKYVQSYVENKLKNGESIDESFAYKIQDICLESARMMEP